MWCKALLIIGVLSFLLGFSAYAEAELPVLNEKWFPCIKSATACHVEIRSASFPAERMGRTFYIITRSTHAEVTITALHLLTSQPLMETWLNPGDVFYRCLVPLLEKEIYPYECLLVPHPNPTEIDRALKIAKEQEKVCGYDPYDLRICVQNLTLNRRIARDINSLVEKPGFVIAVYVEYDVSLCQDGPQESTTP